MVNATLVLESDEQIKADLEVAKSLADDIEHQISQHANTLPDVARKMAKALSCVSTTDDPKWLANVLVEHLNAFVKDENIQPDIQMMVSTRAECSDAIVEHPYIVAYEEEDGEYSLGVLGLLNGMIALSGYRIAAIYRAGRLSSFGLIRIDSEGVDA
jgi:hypothetical protein